MKHIGEYEGLIFDCDGTLVDTMPVHFISMSKAFETHGVTFTEDRFYKLGGIPLLQVIETLATESGVKMADPESFAASKEAIFFDMLSEIKPVAETLEVVQSHHGHLPMAVASGSPRESVRLMLSALSLTDYFVTYLGEEDVQKGKPEPDIFLAAAEQLKVKPEKCIVYEDAPAGIEAATRAGMAVIDVRTYHTPRRVTPSPGR